MDNRTDYVPHGMHIPYTADGLGTYSAEDLHVCYQSNEKAIPLVLEAIKSSVVQPGSVFTIVDYGTADGGTSMPVMYESVKAIREKYGEEMPITIIYEDQPVNDFKSVFMRLQGFIPGPRSYMKDFPNVFVMACGTNFYSQCVPRNTVHLGFSGTCVHVLRKKPCDITDALHPINMTDQKEKQMFSEQAEKDWELFLLNRAEELAPGGYMVLAQEADEKQLLYGQTHYTREALHGNFCSIWKAFVQEGIISQEEFKRTNFSLYIRTLEEFKKPFVNDDSPVRRKGLELVSMDTHVNPCAYRARWIREKGDHKEHAKGYITFLRTWGNATFFSGLSDSRSTEEKSKIVDELYRRVESLVAKNPEDYGVDSVLVNIVIRKRQ